MNITETKIPIREIVKGYEDKKEEGVLAYGGFLQARPKYQREFVYDKQKQKAVIETIMKGFPISIMYWVKNGENDYEILDGQQRTLSICEFYSNNVNLGEMYYANLPQDKKDVFLDYELTIYICEGTDSEKLEWFKVVNMEGLKLTNQELRNAVYAGIWLTDAKRYFSKRACPALSLGKDYVSGRADRQEVLETVLKWISNRDGINIEEYMAQHQNDKDAIALWDYFSEVINWVRLVFPKYRSIMKGQDWGVMYNRFGTEKYDSDVFEERIKELLMDNEVTSQKGIYEYLLDGQERHLSIRAFTNADKIKIYERQNHRCADCGEQYAMTDMEADHIQPWSCGGKTTVENGQLLCKNCHKKKSHIGT